MPGWLRVPALLAAALVSYEGAMAQATGQAAAPHVTELAGARDRPGLFTQRLVLPANFCGPIHVHDRELHGLVLRGVLRMGVADSAGGIDVREYPAGSFVVVPAGRLHVEGSAPETEIHLSGIGPVETVVKASPGAERCKPGR